MLTVLVYMLNRGTSNKYLLGHNLRVPTYIYIHAICNNGFKLKPQLSWSL